MLTWLVLQTALAIEPDALLQKMDEIAVLRAERLDKQAPTLKPEHYRDAALGRIPTGLVQIEGQSARRAWGVAVVDVPIGPLWAAISDDKGKVDWTKLAYTEVLAGQPCGSPRRVFQYVPIPLFTDRWWVATMTHNDALTAKTQGGIREMRWASDGDFTLPTASAKSWGDQGMHVEFTQGSWFLVDLGGGQTLVEYNTWSDPGGNISARVASSLAASSVDDNIRSMVKGAKAPPNCPIE